MIIWAVGFGVVFMLIEFTIPGIGFFALASLISFLIALYYAMGATTLALTVVTILLIIGIIGFFMVLRDFTKTRLGKKLSNLLVSTSDKGYVSNPSKEQYLGCEGVATTVLRPAGIARFDNIFLDVVTEGVFLEPGTPVKVIAVEGAKIVVRAK